MAAYRFPGPPPADALAYFRAKRLRPAFSWLDVWREEHATAFTVAKLLQADLLDEVRASLDAALAAGQTFEQWRQALEPLLRERGWWGVQDVTDPDTGEVIEAELGSPRRLRLIFNTNLRTAHAAGQWARIERTRDSHPYLLYSLGPAREHRLQHVGYAGTLLPVGDGWWRTHMPPNGWGCKCRVRQVSEREAARLRTHGMPDAAAAPIRDEQGNLTGRRSARTVPIKEAPPAEGTREFVNRRTGEVTRVPEGIDPGWDYNPGQVARQAHAETLLAERLRALPADLAAAIEALGRPDPAAGAGPDGPPA